MKTKNQNKAIVDAAKEWQASQKTVKEFRAEQKQHEIELEKKQKEAQEHRDVMNAFHNFYHVEFKETIDEPYWPYNQVDIYTCKVEYPPQEMIDLLMQRGNHEEIMNMIKVYQYEPPTSRNNLEYIETCNAVQMPDCLQNFIAQRGNFEEIALFCSKQGFGATGQDILLNRGNHEELMWYLERHGFLPEQQKKLIARGNYDEIRQHILHHCLADEFLDHILDDLKNGKTENFYKFIALHELPVHKQTAFLEIAKEPEFMAYIDRHGFWQEVLPNLVQLRSQTELTAYIKKHHYLGQGYENLAKLGNTKLSMLYVTEGCDYSLPNLIKAFSSVAKLDYDVLVKLYHMVERPDYRSMTDSQIKELELIQDGAHKKVMAFLKEQTQEFHLFIEASLFFRNSPKEYEFYLNNIGRRKDK